MDRAARWATAHGVAKSRTRLSDEHLHSMPPALGVDYASCSVSGSISTCTPLHQLASELWCYFLKGNKVPVKDQYNEKIDK